jgi:hypothetical protein
MKRAILLLVVLVGGAFYLGWFTFTTDDSGQSEHVNIVIDKNKVHADEARAIEKLHSFEQQAESQAGQAALSGTDRSARRPVNPPQATPYEVPQPAEYQPEPAFNPAPPPSYPTGQIEPPAAGSDPYEVPAAPRPASRPAAETAESFSRGFQ